MIELFKSMKLDKDIKTPLYLQLFEKIREMIVSGSLLPGFRLPSIRYFSGLLDVNQITVVSAFKQLERDGFLTSRAGSGTYVTANIPVSPPNGIILDELYHQDDISMINNGQIKVNENTIDFASATPSPDLFPVGDFKSALNEVLERDKGSAFGYQDSQGYSPLREAIADIIKTYGIGCCTDDIQVISGAQQGIDIISKAFLNQGNFVITESPTYTGAIAVFRSRGAEIADIEMEEDGPNLEILEYSLKKYKARLIYTIPSFQNPTGCSYSDEKRLEILRLADRYNAYIIEDDYVSDLNFENRKLTPFKAMDDKNRVIYIKSFSKIFMPGLRLGFMISPNTLKGGILEAKHTTDISTSGLLQRAFDLYIRKGYWDKHFNFMFEIYKERYERIIDSIDRYMPDGVSYKKPGGGLNIWLSLPYGFPVNSLFGNAASNDIVFAPGRVFYSNSSQTRTNNLRLSFAAVSADYIEQGIEKLGEMIDSILKKQSNHRSMPIL